MTIALLSGALHFGLNFWALRAAGDISSVAIALQSYIPMSAVLAVVFLGESIGWRTWAGIGLIVGECADGLDRIRRQRFRPAAHGAPLPARRSEPTQTSRWSATDREAARTEW